jgi:hypothetical protein
MAQTYEQICNTLGFLASVKFVTVTPTGSIGFTTGKPEEILSLLAAVRAHGMTPSRGLLLAARRICPHLETPLAAQER